MGQVIAIIGASPVPPKMGLTPGKGSGTLFHTGATVDIYHIGDAVIPAGTKVYVHHSAGGLWTITKVIT